MWTCAILKKIPHTHLAVCWVRVERMLLEKALASDLGLTGTCESVNSLQFGILGAVRETERTR